MSEGRERGFWGAFESWRVAFELWRVELDSWRVEFESRRVAFESRRVAFEPWRVEVEGFGVGLEGFGGAGAFGGLSVISCSRQGLPVIPGAGFRAAWGYLPAPRRFFCCWCIPGFIPCRG